MFRIVKTGCIDMAHRIRGHEGKCRFIHGHTWKVEVSVSCVNNSLNALGMVIDFGVLKKEFFQWLDDKFDHSFVLGQGDEEDLTSFSSHDAFTRLASALGVDKLNVVFLPFDVTAERFAQYLFKECVVRLNKARAAGARPLTVDYIRVYESLHPNESYAEYSPNPVR